MAEAVLVAIGEILANQVPQALEKIGKLWGVKHEFEELRNIVSTLRAVLDDAEKKCYQNDQIQVWLDNMKDALYDAQDVLEEFNIEAMQRELRGHNEVIKEVRTFFSSSNQLAFNLKMSSNVRAVRKKIEDINTRRKYHLDERLVDSRVEREQKKREEMHSFIPKEVIIGRDNDKNKVMEFLLDPNVTKGVSILPIVGVGGLGKTALAQCVYNDEMVSKHFHLKMWVCVSDDFDMKKIVTKILACIKQRGPEVEMEQLQHDLRTEIGGKKYLLVLDDLWNDKQEEWLSLKNLLVEGARGSKILITTRLPLVADIAGTALPYHLKGLSESASLDLLMQMACPKEEKIQDLDKLAIGKEIVKECYGVPLVVRTVGSLLYSKKTTSEWLNFRDYELPEVSQKEDRIISILRLSYDHLPSHLKQCFAFCSLFPKDYKIKKQTLVNLWMAEGFIRPSNRGQHLEDIAHGYFMNLLWRNFFQEFQEDVETCKMHDLMHDLACLVAGTECCVAWDGIKSIHKNTCHMSHRLTFDLMDRPPISCLKASALRTILSLTGYRIMSLTGYRIMSLTRFWGMQPTSELDIHQLIQRFKRLRLLDLHDTNIKKVPRSIYKLKHLTYLDLSYNGALKRLPNSITRLHNLQTLNLHYCKSLEELPRDIRKLVSLRNLDIDGCVALSYMPRGLGQLSLLHRLSNFILPKDKALAKKYCGLGELNRLNDIRGRLFIENLGSETDAGKESQAANLIGKRFLEILTLSWGNFDITDEAIIKKRDEALLEGLRPPKDLQELSVWGFKGERFPGWLTNLPNLVKLRLWSCTRCRHFPQVGLNKLKKLRMENMESLEYIPEECLKSLTLLESLYFKNLPRLTSLPPGLRHLSKLVDLTIWECKELDLSKDESGNIILDFHELQSLRSVFFIGIPKLESLPQWILQLRNLERLVISSCPNLKALPEGMRRLTSLTHLKIYECPELKERCKSDAGEDWYKIAHILHLDITP